MTVARGAGANLVALGLSQVLAAVAGIVVARKIGPDGVGALALVFGLFAVLHPFVAFTATPSVVQYAKTPDPARVFGTSLTLKLAVGALLFGAGAAGAPWIARALDVPPLLVVLGAAGLLAAVGYEVVLNRLEAEGRMVARAVVLPVGPLVYLALVASVAVDAVGAGAATVLGSVAMSFVALRFMAGIRPAFDRPVAAFYARMGSRLVVGDLLFLGLVWFDTFFVNLFLGKAAAGIYQTAYNLGLLLMMAAAVLEVVTVPLLAAARVRGTDLARAYHQGSLLALGLGALTALVAVPFGRSVLGLYGPAFVAAYPSLLALVVMGAAGALFFPVRAVLAAVERPDVTMRITALEFAVNLPLNVLLIPRMGILGAAVAAAIGFGLGTVVGWVRVKRIAGVLPFPPLREWPSAVRGMF